MDSKKAKKNLAEELKCWQVRECNEIKRLKCSAYKERKNCWEVMEKKPSPPCALNLKNCVQKNCPVFLDNAEQMTKAWLWFRKKHVLHRTTP